MKNKIPDNVIQFPTFERVKQVINEKIDKYQSLARDAFSSGDRIAGENFRQHAEHFLRVNSANKKINT